MVLAVPELTKASSYHNVFALNEKGLFAVECPHSGVFLSISRRKRNSGRDERIEMIKDGQIDKHKVEKEENESNGRKQ